MKPFFKSVLRIATAMLLVVLVVGLSVWGFRSWSSYREARRNASLEQPREWPKIKMSSSENTTLSLATIWRNGWMSYKFEIEGVPSRARGDVRGRDWFLEFIDANGFEVWKHKVPPMSAVLGAEGKLEGLEIRSKTSISAEDYRRARTWEVSWTD